MIAIGSFFDLERAELCRADDPRRNCRPLPPRRWPARVSVEPHVHREKRLIAPELLAGIRRVVAGEAPWPLVLIGQPGTGKTCAALIVLDFASGIYVRGEELCSRLRTLQFGPNPVEAADLWREWSTHSVAVLDELGLHPGEGQATQARCDVIKRAVDERLGRPLIAISNLDLDALAAYYDPRIADRLSAGTVLRVAGRSRRRPVRAAAGLAAGDSDRD